MSIDYDAILYGPIYDSLGVEATLTPNGSSGPVTVTAIDKTAGVSVADSPEFEVQTIRPVAAVRAAELSEKGIANADLVDGTLEMNGTVWRILSYLEKPSPAGAGEYWLILIEEDAT